MALLTVIDSMRGGGRNAMRIFRWTNCRDDYKCPWNGQRRRWRVWLLWTPCLLIFALLLTLGWREDTVVAQEATTNLFTSARDALANREYERTNIIGFSVIKTGFASYLSRGAVLVGFEMGIGKHLSGREAVFAIRPIFQTSQGDKVMENQGLFANEMNAKQKPLGGGATRTVRLRAKYGYAVGAIHMRSTVSIHGMALTFQRIDGTALQVNDSEDSEWVGDKTTGRLETISTDGRLPIGVIGNRDETRVLAVGLILMTKGRAISPPSGKPKNMAEKVSVKTPPKTIPDKSKSAVSPTAVSSEVVAKKSNNQPATSRPVLKPAPKTTTASKETAAPLSGSETKVDPTVEKISPDQGNVAGAPKPKEVAPKNIREQERLGLKPLYVALAVALMSFAGSLFLAGAMGIFHKPSAPAEETIQQKNTKETPDESADELLETREKTAISPAFPEPSEIWDKVRKAEVIRDQAHIEIDAAKLVYVKQLIRQRQNLPLAILAALAVGAALSFLWGAVVGITGLQYELEWIPIVGIGFLVGITVRVIGQGIDMHFGVAGALIALLASMAGNIQATSLALPWQLTEVDNFIMRYYGDWENWTRLVWANTGWIDFACIAFGVWEAFHLSFYRLTPAQLATLAPRGTLP